MMWQVYRLNEQGECPKPLKVFGAAPADIEELLRIGWPMSSAAQRLCCVELDCEIDRRFKSALAAAARLAERRQRDEAH